MEMVWMTNDIGGYIYITPLCLYIRFSHSKKERCYRIDGKTLYEQLRKMKDEFEVKGPGQSDLIFIPLTQPSGEKDVAILIKENAFGKGPDKDQAVVCRKDLVEALYFWIG